MRRMLSATDVRSGVDLSDPDFDLTQLYAVLDNRFALNVYYHSATFGDSGQPLDMSEGGKDSPSFSENATRRVIIWLNSFPRNRLC